MRKLITSAILSLVVIFAYGQRLTLTDVLDTHTRDTMLIKGDDKVTFSADTIQMADSAYVEIATFQQDSINLDSTLVIDDADDRIDVPSGNELRFFNPVSGSEFYRVTNGGNVTLYGQSVFGTGEIRHNHTVSYYPTFYANNAEVMRLSTDGNVGIGGAPHVNSLLDLYTGSVQAMEYDTGDDRLKLHYTGGVGDSMQIYQNSATEGIIEFPIAGTIKGGNAITVQVAHFSFGNSNMWSNNTANKFGFGYTTNALAGDVKLGIRSTDKGFLPPQQTEAQFEAIGDPQNMMMVVDTTNNMPVFYDEDGDQWFNSGERPKTRYEGAGSYTVLVTDHIIVKTANTGGGTDDVTLPATPPDNKIFIIKDGGTAATNNFDIVCSGGCNIDGVATQTMSTNYASITVLFDGTNYLIL